MPNSFIIKIRYFLLHWWNGHKTDFSHHKSEIVCKQVRTNWSWVKCYNVPMHHISVITLDTASSGTVTPTSSSSLLASVTCSQQLNYKEELFVRANIWMSLNKPSRKMWEFEGMTPGRQWENFWKQQNNISWLDWCVLVGGMFLAELCL